MWVPHTIAIVRPSRIFSLICDAVRLFLNDRFKSLSREIDRVNAEATQLKADLAAARTETEASNREVREITRALHAAEIEVTRLQTALQSKEEALQVEITRRAAADNAVAELRSQIKSPSQNAQGIGLESFRPEEPPFAT
jgi:chromosome segregation ATPase